MPELVDNPLEPRLSPPPNYGAGRPSIEEAVWVCVRGGTVKGDLPG